MNCNNATAVLFHILELIHTKSRKYKFQNKITNLYFTGGRKRGERKESSTVYSEKHRLIKTFRIKLVVRKYCAGR